LNTEGTFAENVTTRTTKERKKRKDVRGAPGWQVNADGSIFYKNHRKDPANKQPVIALGKDYAGPLLPAYGNQHGTVFVDEVVAVEYLGLPRTSAMWMYPNPDGYALKNGVIAGAYPRHLDGNPSNCAAENLVWVIDPECAEIEDARILLPNHIANRPRRPGPGLFKWSPSRQDEPLWVASHYMCDWTPKGADLAQTNN